MGGGITWSWALSVRSEPGILLSDPPSPFERWHGILDGHAFHVTHLDGLLIRPLGRVVEELVQFALLGLSYVFLEKETEF